MLEVEKEEDRVGREIWCRTTKSKGRSNEAHRYLFNSAGLFVYFQGIAVKSRI